MAPKKILVSVVACASLTLALGAAAWGIVAIGSTRRLAAATARWEASVGPLRATPDAVLADNGPADKLDHAARQLGLGLTLCSTEPPRVSFTGYRRGLTEYVHGEIASGGAGVFPPPPELAEWLEANRRGVDVTIRTLASDRAPEWHLPEWGPSERIGHILGHLAMNRVLLLAALDASSRGEDAEALCAFEAAWSLRESIGGKPSLMVNFVAIAEGREQAGVLRRLRGVSEEWRTRVEDLNYCANVIHALESDASQLAWRPARSGTLGRMRDALDARWHRLAVADALDARRRLIESQRSGADCFENAAALDAEFDANWPRWREARTSVTSTRLRGIELP